MMRVHQTPRVRCCHARGQHNRASAHDVSICVAATLRSSRAARHAQGADATATIFALSTAMVSLPLPSDMVNEAFSRKNVQTLSQNRYVCKWPCAHAFAPQMLHPRAGSDNTTWRHKRALMLALDCTLPASASLMALSNCKGAVRTDEGHVERMGAGPHLCQHLHRDGGADQTLGNLCASRRVPRRAM